MKRTLSRLLVPVIAIVVALASSPTSASAAPALPVFYKTAYSPAIYAVYEGETYNVTYDQWAALGYPRPQPSPTDYVKYSWAPSVYAVTYWPDGWMWDRLDYPMWQTAGFPNARLAGYIEGTGYYQWNSSTELFAYAPDDDISHKLSFAEWQASGFKAAQVFNAGFFQLSWITDATLAPVIFYQDFAAEDVSPVEFEEWAYEDYPTPQKVNRLIAHDFFQNDGEPTIYYDGPTIADYPLSLEEWLAAGAPEPVVR